MRRHRPPRRRSLGEADPLPLRQRTYTPWHLPLGRQSAAQGARRPTQVVVALVVAATPVVCNLSVGIHGPSRCVLTWVAVVHSRRYSSAPYNRQAHGTSNKLAGSLAAYFRPPLAELFLCPLGRCRSPREHVEGILYAAERLPAIGARGGPLMCALAQEGCVGRQVRTKPLDVWSACALRAGAPSNSSSLGH